MNGWRNTFEPASFWSPASARGGTLPQCNLCPRQCTIPAGGFGFCGVRGNVGDRICTFSYGKCVDASEEVIETEAVYHYAPGSRTINLGNIGCMMDCEFCQNWRTSQVSHLSDEVVRYFTPADIVSLCEEHKIGILSWTYNDPVVWHEFVVETSRLARASGIRTLYKSSLYIQPEPLAELIDTIDVFSISLKSMSDAFYRRYTKAALAPVLDGIKAIRRSGRHLEISQLIVTGLNDTPDDARGTVDWVLSALGDDVPLHFVGFHPAYRYVHRRRTPAEILLAAQAAALTAGVRRCYVGNLYSENVNDTKCPACEAVLVRRFGLHTEVAGLDGDGRCAGCGADTDIQDPFHARPHNDDVGRCVPMAGAGASYAWRDDIDNVHIAVPHRAGGRTHPVDVRVAHVPSGRRQRFRIGGGLNRAIVSRSCPTDSSIAVTWNGDDELVLMPLKDRAQYPLPNGATDDFADLMEADHGR